MILIVNSLMHTCPPHILHIIFLVSRVVNVAPSLAATWRLAQTGGSRGPAANAHLVSRMFCWESFMWLGRLPTVVPMVTYGGSCDMTPKYEYGARLPTPCSWAPVTYSAHGGVNVHLTGGTAP